MSMKEYELAELKESLKNCNDCLLMEMSSNEALRKEIQGLKAKLAQYKTHDIKELRDSILLYMLNTDSNALANLNKTLEKYSSL